MIVFLTQKMSPGFGVAVVVEQVSRRLAAMGHAVTVGCLEREGVFPDLDIQVVDPHPGRFLEWISGFNCRAVAAHASPFFELLPSIASRFPCYAWEHGDPTPDFFQEDREIRQAMMDHKRKAVYPRTSGVFAISEFVRHEIQYPLARVLYNGCDHVPDMGPKGRFSSRGVRGRPLTVGTLTRLGAGEAHYKGIAHFRLLKDACDRQGLPVRFEVMGRGSEADAVPLREQGIEVRINADESEKAAYLRRLDLFVSCSQWEGFNLPLVEAQAMGTAAMAFEVGAHPEVTPLLMGNFQDAVALIEAYVRRPELLAEHAAACYRFVRRRFRWNDTVVRFLGGIDA